MITGPTHATRELFASLCELTGKVFRPSLIREYPQLFHKENWPLLRIMVDGNVVASHVGMTFQHASLFGCDIKVACIGGVCTLPEYRGKGLATTLFADAVRLAREEGVDLMLTSGSRSIYLKAGSAFVGQGGRAAVRIAPSGPRLVDGIKIKRVSADSIDLLAALYDREPARFQRGRVPYEWAFQSGFVMNSLSDFYLVTLRGTPVAYSIVQRPGKGQETVNVVEYAGERAALIDAWPLMAARYGLDTATAHVHGWDAPLAGLLRGLRLRQRPEHASGVYLIVNFAQLMNKLAPLFRRRIGKSAEKLRFAETRQGFTIKHGRLRHALKDRQDLARLLWGGDLSSQPRGPMAELLAPVLPLPELWYGINYV